MAKVRIKNVVKRFDRQEAVKQFSLDIDDSEFIVLVGPSGCGKTTLLRMVAGLETVTEGEIFIDDERVTHTPPKKRDISMVFQNYALYPHMTVFNNLAFSLKLRKYPRSEIKDKVVATAAMLGLDQFLDRHPNQLSGGQKQRVALGRAIVRDPKLFLFDEPLSNLDAKLRVSMRTEILEIHRRLANTSIYVTHDQMEAMTMGSRIVVMRDGAIQQQGTPQTIYSHPVNKFVGSFIGSPAMNLVRCDIESSNGKIFLVSESFRLPVSDARAQQLSRLSHKAVTLGVRPESLFFVDDPESARTAETFRTSIGLVEPLGAEQLVHFKIGMVGMVARLEPRIPLKYGDTVTLGIRMSDAHIFDVDTETNIDAG